MNIQQIPADTVSVDKNINIINKIKKISLGEKIIFIGFALAVPVFLIGLAYYGWKEWKGSKILSDGVQTLEYIGGAVEKITESATRGVLPSIQTNPLENEPDLNPADKANPFKNIKTNPFE